jgi:sugar lactone lactonase YvrE
MNRNMKRFISICLIIFFAFSLIHINSLNFFIVDNVSSSTTWEETDWSAAGSYNLTENVNTTVNKGNIKLSYGTNLFVCDYNNGLVIKTKMDGSEWMACSNWGTNVYAGGIYFDNTTKYLYLSDTASNRIVKTKLDGTGWTTYGTSGNGTGQFDQPTGIAYESETGYLYIADKNNHRIVKTMMGGTGWTTYGSLGIGTDEFLSPMGLFYDDSTDNLYIADSVNNRIVKTKFGGTGWSKLGTVGSSAGQFIDPRGVFYDKSTNNLFISDSGNNRIVKCKFDGSGWVDYGSYGKGFGQFHTPLGIRYDNSSGYIFICDNQNNRIIKTKMGGSGWTTLGKLGSGDGKFNGPSGICLSSADYCSEGYLISSPFEISGENFKFKTISWTSTTNSFTSIKFQLRTASTKSALSSKDFVGSEGTYSSNYIKSGETIWSEHGSDSWIQYKVYLSTTDNSQTPELHDATITYNYPPSVSNLQITPASPVTTDDFNASYAYIDPDLDTENGTKIRWYKDTILQSTFNDQTTIPSNVTAKGQEWYFTVKPCDGSDFGTLVTSQSITIKNSPPTKPNGLTPSTGIIYIMEETTVEASWTQSTDSDSSDTITYDIYGELNNPNPSMLIEANSTDVVTTLTGLINDGPYYWKVVASDDINDTVSDIVSFMVNKNSPPVVTLISPMDGEKIASSNAELLWTVNDTDDDSPIYYNVYLNTLLSSVIIKQSSVLISEAETSTTYYATGLVDGTYYWTVIPNDGQINGSCISDVWHFKIEKPPNAPTPVKLSIESTTSTSITLKWSEYVGNDFSKYEIYSSNFSSIIPDANTLKKTITEQTKTTHVVTGLDKNTTFYFIIRVINGDDLFADSNEVFAKTSITGVTNKPPEKVDITLSDVSDTSIILTWTENNDEDFLEYEVHKSRLVSFIPSDLTLETSISDQTTTSYNVTGLEPNTTYYFLVRVMDTSELVADSDIVSGATQAKGEAVNKPPTAYAGADKIVEVGQEVKFEGTGNDPDGQVVLYEWDFDGDGTWNWVSKTISTPTHVYGKTGEYIAVLRITDNSGESATKTITIQVIKTEDEDKDDDINPLIFWTIFGVFISILILIVAIISLKVKSKKSKHEESPKEAHIHINVDDQTTKIIDKHKTKVDIDKSITKTEIKDSPIIRSSIKTGERTGNGKEPDTEDFYEDD